MTAALGGHLILDVQSGNAAHLVLAHGARHIQFIPVAGVGIGDQGQLHRARQYAGALGHLAHREEPVVREAACGRCAGAGHIYGVEAGLLDHFGRHAIVGAGRNEDLRAQKKFAKPVCG